MDSVDIEVAAASVVADIGGLGQHHELSGGAGADAGVDERPGHPAGRRGSNGSKGLAVRMEDHDSSNRDLSEIVEGRSAAVLTRESGEATDSCSVDEVHVL